MLVAQHRVLPARLSALAAAVTIGSWEMIRSCIAIMGTRGFVPYALYGQPWLIQPVSLCSIFGLSMLIMLVNYALAQGVLALLDRRRPPDPAQPAVAARLAACWLAGASMPLSPGRA